MEQYLILKCSHVQEIFLSYWQCVNVALHSITDNINTHTSDSVNVDGLPSRWSVPPLWVLQLSLSSAELLHCSQDYNGCVVCAKLRCEGVLCNCLEGGVHLGLPAHAHMLTFVCVRVCVWQVDRIRDEVLWRSQALHFCKPKAHWGC